MDDEQLGRAMGKRPATLIGEAIAESKIDLAAMMGGYDALGAAVLARLEAAGMVLVPRKATERMAEAYLEEYLDNDASTPMECRIAALNAAIAAATEADNG